MVVRGKFAVVAHRSNGGSIRGVPPFIVRNANDKQHFWGFCRLTNLKPEGKGGTFNGQASHDEARI